MDLQDVKSYLKITWNEDDDNIIQFISSGKSFLDDVAGVELNYTDDYVNIQLLKDYCRYAYNHSLELFEKNFKHDLLKLSIREAVKLHEATTSDI